MKSCMLRVIILVWFCIAESEYSISKSKVEPSCKEKASTGRNKFIVEPKDLDREWKLPFRNATKIWKEFVPWIDKPVKLEDLPLSVQNLVIRYRHSEQFNVTYERKHPCWKLIAIDLFCEMKKQVIFRTIKYGDGPFIGKEWKKALPAEEFDKELPRYKSCAVVSSSSSLKNLGLRNEIDSHDAVIRYNFAPVTGFESDVGARTTIRMINSMAFYTEYEKFLNVSTDDEIIFHFDPSKYRVDISTWFAKPQFPFHKLFQKHRKLHPKQKFFLIDPISLWNMWDFIQDYTGDEIQKIITSSGFMGNIIAMNLCDVTHVYGYLPSVTSVTKKCYYFKDFEDMTCTYGGYHPELYEKNIMVQLRQGEYDDIYQWGRITLPGFNDFHCED